MSAEYTEDSIRSLDWKEHIRLRPGMYIGKLGDGSSHDDGIYVLMKEIIDNSIDEYVMGHGKVIEVTVSEKEVTIRDYGPACLLVPYFMRRPYDMILVLTDTTKQYLHQLSKQDLMAVAEGWRDAIRAISSIMPAIGREIAYNVVTHNGPGAGLYFEFLPYTQETGGFEHLGLIVCQANPGQAAEQLRGVIGSKDR